MPADPDPTSPASPGPERLARALQGAGGAPGRPGVVHVVGVEPSDPASLTVRGAVLLSSATAVVTALTPGHPVLRLAGRAGIVEVAVGEQAVDALVSLVDDEAVVVRLVPGTDLAGVDGLEEEVAGLEERGLVWEADPVPPGGPLARFRTRLPLSGLTVLNPRAVSQAPALSMHVRSLGGRPVEAPTIAIRPGDLRRLDEAVTGLAAGDFEALCLTSPNGVDALAATLDRQDLDSRALAGADLVACVGPGTARRLRVRLAVTADLVPTTTTTAGLAGAFPEGPGRVLLPRADIATNRLRERLGDTGWTPVEVDAYRTVCPSSLPPPAQQALAAGEVDLVALSSSSTARNLLRLTRDLRWEAGIVSIGPVTSATCREQGIEPLVEAERHDLAGLVAALCTAAASLGTG